MSPRPPASGPAAPRRRWPAALQWTAAGLLSAFACVQAARWPPPPPAFPLPPPRARPLSAREQAELHALTAGLQAQLEAAAARLGRWPAIEELEGLDAQGEPLLPTGLPDNPAADGVGWALAWCPGEPAPPVGPDWLYCPRTGRLVAPGLDPSPAAEGGATEGGGPQ